MKLRVFIISLILLGLPIISAHGAPVYVFPVTGCEYTYAKAHHDYPATDILAPAGCKFVAPINGVVDEVNRIDRWSGKKSVGPDRGGLYVSIIGDDGVRYYGSHLRSIPASIEAGVVVKAGRLLGSIGSSGSARGTAPHLHFGISWPTPLESGAWWVRRGMIWPWKYLDAWKVGKDASALKEITTKKSKTGEIPAAPK